MRRRPKYKVGDILERWMTIGYQESSTFHFMVVKLTGSKCGYLGCLTCKHGLTHYLLRDINSAELDSWEIRVVDMIDWNASTKYCSAGWRRVA